MTESTHVANYMLESILRDLNFLKENNFLPAQTYRDVVSILPSRIESTTPETNHSKPPLPIRKSTNSSNGNLVASAAPIAQPRSITNEYPKLPVRRTNEWQQPSPATSPAQLPPPTMIVPAAATTATNNITRNILHTATPEPAPPAYTQKPTTGPEPLATAEALYDYQGEDPSTDLSFKQGNIIEVTEYVNDDWWKGTVNGKSGIFPQNHVKKIAPTIKAKRPWAPPTSAKPSFSTSSNTSNTSSYTHQQHQPSPQMQPAAYNNTQQPYSYPPPPTAMYQAPPMQPPAQSYAQPSSVPVVAQPGAEGGQEGDKKVQNMAKKFGGHVATAATWGFGATLGSQAANAIF